MTERESNGSSREESQQDSLDSERQAADLQFSEVESALLEPTHLQSTSPRPSQDTWADVRTSVRRFWQRMTGDDASTPGRSMRLLAERMEQGYDATKERAEQSASQLMTDGSEKLRTYSSRMQVAARDGLDKTAQVASQKPLHTVAVTFAAGLGLGLLFGMRSRRRHNISSAA